MIDFKKFLYSIFIYKEPPKINNFSLESNVDINKKISNSKSEKKESKIIYPTLSVNVDYIKLKYNTLINSDIKIREFKLNIKGKEYNSILLFIDGMINSESINNFILKPIMEQNSESKKNLPTVVTNNISVRKIKKFDLEDYVTNALVPQNTMTKVNTFDKVFNSVNMRRLCFIYRYSSCFISY